MSPHTTSHPLNVLLVEDEALLGDAVAATLRAIGHEVTVASSALEALQHPEHDVVISDVRLPIVSGFELLNLLRQRGSVSPIVLTSGSVDDDDRARASAAGAYDILPKPFAMSDLIDIVERAGASCGEPANGVRR